MLLIGSEALSIRLAEHNVPCRKPLDVDIMCTYEDCEKFKDTLKFPHFVPFAKGKKIHAKQKSGKNWEFELAWGNSTVEELITLVKEDAETIKFHNFQGTGLTVLIPSLDVLFALKSSHRFLKNSPHFEKTRKDYLLMQSLGVKIPERYKTWYSRRVKETYWYKHPSLKQGKDSFFNPNEGVQYVYDHDSIHKAVAYPLPPAYTLYMKDGAEVECDKEKFFSLPEEVRLRGVIEEAYVLALERSQIPFKNKGIPPEWSFKFALTKVCTSITSGWFRQYAWEVYDKALATYDRDYVGKLYRGIDMGIVKPYNPETAAY